MKPEGFEDIVVLDGEYFQKQLKVAKKILNTDTLNPGSEVESLSSVDEISDLKFFKQRLYEGLQIKEVDHSVVYRNPEPTCSLIVLKSKIAAQKAEKEKD